MDGLLPGSFLSGSRHPVPGCSSCWDREGLVSALPTGALPEAVAGKALGEEASSGGGGEQPHPHSPGGPGQERASSTARAFGNMLFGPRARAAGEFSRCFPAGF